MILKTTNGGDAWISQTIPNNSPERSIQDLFFFNADTGYAVSGAAPTYGGGVGLIYKTTNGGQTWSINYSPSMIANFYAIDFPENSQVGYVAGIMGSSGQYKVIKTTNGGVSWTPQGVEGPDGIANVTSMSFANNLVGYIGYRSGGYHIMRKTTNGGANWFVMNTTTWHHYYDIEVINENIVYTVGTGGMIRKTTNGGSVWIAEEKKDERFEVENSNGSLVVFRIHSGITL